MNELTPVVDNYYTIESKGYYIYKGLDKTTNNLVYIGTTVQRPRDRFRWHKANKKDLIFEVIKICTNAEEMLQVEFDLIQKYKPKLNKITKRKQNLNVKLTQEQLDKRRGDTEWCQNCFKRRAKWGNTCGRC